MPNHTMPPNRLRSHNAVIHVYDDAGNVIETHEQAGDFQRPLKYYPNHAVVIARIALASPMIAR